MILKAMTRLRSWRENDPVGVAVLAGGSLFAFLLTLGIPLWDDDFTSWFRKIQEHSIFRYLWEWIWPVSTQPEYWGFNERPVQSLIYKFFYGISGYHSWSYFLFKSLIYGLVGWRIYCLALLLGGNVSIGARRAAAAIAGLYLVSPGPVAALILHQDLAPLAALVNLLLLEWIYRSVEATPLGWKGLPRLSDPAQRRWVLQWLGISFCIYLGYKTKADVKLLGPVLALYVVLVRRHQWAYFAIPVAACALLAVPWGPGIFSKLPPFIPGSGGSSVGWMFQEARFSRVFSYLWNPENFDWRNFYRSAPLSLAGVLGPFVLIVAAGFAVWRIQGDDHPLSQTRKSSSGRAWLLFALWWVMVLAATSALSDINFTFRIRYGILTLTPTAVLLAGLAVAFVTSLKELPKWVLPVATAALVLQSGMNLWRSGQYRRDIGLIMVAVDHAYDRVRRDFQDHRLALLPDFRPYDYRPGAGRVFDEKTSIQSTDELEKSFPAGKTVAISWHPTLWEQMELVEFYRGCQWYSPFDWIWPCQDGVGAALMRWLGRSPEYERGEQLRAQGKHQEARQVHEQFLREHPGSLAARFVIGLESFSLQDWNRSWEVFSELASLFPENNAVLYNAGLAAMETKRYGQAAQWLETVVSREPSNYPVLMNLQETYRRAEKNRARQRVIGELERLYPTDPKVKSLRN